MSRGLKSPASFFLQDAVARPSTREESRYGSRQNRPCVSTGPELLLFGDKQPQGPNANRAVKPDGRGKDMLEIRKNQDYIARTRRGRDASKR